MVFPRSHMIYRVLLALTALGCVAWARVQAAEAAWPPKVFPISFWCGPPEPYITVEQYRRIAQAGFNVVMQPCEGAATVARNRKILETAHATGLKVIITDPRMPLSVSGNTNARAVIKAIVADYRRYPALLGYFLTDEPGAGRFAGLAEVEAELHKLDPDHMVYINLFPNYASNDLTATLSQLQTDSYDSYLSKFMSTVKPDVLSWDHYHFLTNGDRTGFFENLFSGQQAALSTQPPTPFWQIVLSVQHGPYRALNENELRFEAMQTLVYGASGLVYFTYWLPRDPTFQWSHAIMNADGTPGPLYDPVKQVNREVKTLAKWLYGAQVLETFQAGVVPPDGRPRPSSALVKVIGEGNLSLGEFRDGQGYLYIMVTNRDYTKGVSTKIAVDSGAHPIQRLDVDRDHWSAMKGTKDNDDLIELPVELGPAGAALIRWQ